MAIFTMPNGCRDGCTLSVIYIVIFSPLRGAGNSPGQQTAEAYLK